MSATGDVTILDAARRRRYVLVRAVPAESIATGSEPDVPEALATSSEAADRAPSVVLPEPILEPLAAEPSAPSVAQASPDSAVGVQPLAQGAQETAATAAPEAAPTAEVIAPSQPPEVRTHAASTESADEKPPQVADAERVEAAVPAEPPAASEPASEEREASTGELQADGQRSLPRAKQTLAYSAMRAQALKREFEVSRSLTAAASSPAIGAPAAESASALPRPGLHAVAPEPRGAGPTSSIPPPPKLPDDVHIRQPSDPVRPRRSMPSAPRLDGLTPLAGRDADPSPQSPLTYRERSYLVARSADRERLEALLQAQFATLRRELVGKPRGQLIHLAVFDHSFDERPLRPPIATLEWRDWRGQAVFVMAGDHEPAEPTAPAAAPRAPESSWPVPLRTAAGAPSRPSSPAPAARSEPPPRAAVAAPASQPPGADAVPGRTPSAPPPAVVPGMSSWPVPPQTPLEPARVLSTAWPVAPQPPPEPVVAPGGPFPPAAAALAPAAEPFRPATIRPSTPPGADAFGPAPARAPASDPFGAPSARPSAADVFAPAPVPSRGHAIDPFAPLPLRPAPAAAFGPPGQQPAVSAAFGPPAAGPQASDSFGPFDARREPTGETDSRLATAFEAMPDLYFLPTPVAGLEFTIQLLNRLVPSEAVSGCLYDINMDVFRFVVLTGPGAIERRAGSVASQAGLFGAAKRSTGEALVVPDVAAESRFDPQVDGRDGLEVKTLAYLPVRHSGQLLGMMQLLNRENDRGYSPSDVAVLTYVTAQLAEFLATRRNLG